MPAWQSIAVLSLGGVLGVNARYWLGVAVLRVTSHPFPWATGLINVLGSFGIGLGAALLAGHSPHSPARLFTLTGFLGGFTTFSTFSLEVVGLWKGGDRGPAMAYALGSVVLGCAAVVAGAAVAGWIERPGAVPLPPARSQGHDDQHRQGRRLEADREDHDRANA